MVHGAFLEHPLKRMRQQNPGARDLSAARPRVGRTGMTYAYRTMDSPVGELTLVAGEAGLAAVLWQDDDPRRVRLGPRIERGDHPVLEEAGRQLGEYFRSEEHTSELQSLMRISYAVFCLKKKNTKKNLNCKERIPQHKTQIQQTHKRTQQK